MALYIFSVIKISGIQPKMVVPRPETGRVYCGLHRAVKPVLYAGTELWGFGFLHITDQGIRVAILMVLRILLLIIGTSMLTYTTLAHRADRRLGDACCPPLKKIHLPVHELAMMMSIALRFIPTLIEETEKIIAAQKARGADFESGNIIQRARAMVPILVPLFISAFRRADELAIAMECRLYRGDVGRTRMKQMKLGRVDALTGAVSVLVFAAVIVLGRMGW